MIVHTGVGEGLMAYLVNEIITMTLCILTVVCLSLVYFFLFQHVICCIFPWYNELYKVNSNLSAAAQVRSFSVTM